MSLEGEPAANRYEGTDTLEAFRRCVHRLPRRDITRSADLLYRAYYPLPPHLHEESHSNFAATHIGTGGHAHRHSLCSDRRVTALSYVLPIRVSRPGDAEWWNYIRWLATRVELIIVDGSEPPVFAQHATGLAATAALHLPPDEDLSRMANGKVAGLLTGLRRATRSFAIVADDDVRYDDGALAEMAAALRLADVVRPQNYFHPLPWHACLDTARTLINRVSGGDWPGTLGVRPELLAATGGYDGDVLFENLELVRTIVAAGGTAACPLDLYVRRLPSTARHFWSQRVRQAYDELARPLRLAVWLSILPVAAGLMVRRRWRWLFGSCGAAIAVAEAGRRRGHGDRVFPVAAAFAAPLWVAERAVCSWLAVASYVRWGGVRYRGRVITRAATPLRQLQDRFAHLNETKPQADRTRRALSLPGAVDSRPATAVDGSRHTWAWLAAVLIGAAIGVAACLTPGRIRADRHAGHSPSD